MVRAKIDTGAYYSLIPLKTLAISDRKCEEIKKDLVTRSDIPEVIISGVEDTYRGKNLSSMTVDDKILFKGLAFLVNIDNISLNGYFLGSSDIFVSCDTQGDILIGMNILKIFDIHIGLSKICGKVVFLGCLKSNITSEYLFQLEKHFGYTTMERKNATLFRNKVLRRK